MILTVPLSSISLIWVGLNDRARRVAFLASNFAFQYLARLLLVHSRWSYHRNNDMLARNNEVLAGKAYSMPAQHLCSSLR